MKKTLIGLLMATMCILLLAGCSGGGTSSKPAEENDQGQDVVADQVSGNKAEEDVNEVAPAKLQTPIVKDFVWEKVDNDIYYAFEVENPNNVSIMATCNVTAKDKDGNEIQNGSRHDTILYIPANGTGYCCNDIYLFDSDVEPATVECVPEEIDERSDTITAEKEGYLLKPSDFEISDIKRTEDAIEGSAKNNSGKSSTNAYVVVVLKDKDGKLLCGGIGAIQKIAAGEKLSFTARFPEGQLGNIPDDATIEAVAYGVLDDEETK